MTERSPTRRNIECDQTLHKETIPKEGYCGTPKTRLITVTEENVKLFKKANQSIFPVNYHENFYKEIVKISKNDPMSLSKIALYEISCDKVPYVKQARQEVCVGAMCCRIIDIDQGKVKVITGKNSPQVTSLLAKDI